MSKELEAFMKYCPIIPSENNFKYWSDYQIALKKYERELQTFTKTFELLKKALTPPTADEVCKALVEQTKTITEVEYSEKLNDFVIFQDIYGEWLGKLSFKEIREILPPHLITLIGRFYEGLEVK